MKKIEGFSYYFITENGDIFSKSTGQIKPLKTRVDSSKYKRVMLYDGKGSIKTFLVHRLVALTYLPNPEDLPCVNHKDGDKLNNHVSNLEWCDHSYNLKHSYDISLRDSIGENNSKNVLSETDVINIYNQLLDGRRVIDVAKDFNVSKSCVIDIRSRKNWSYLTNNLPDIPYKSRKEPLSDVTVKWVCYQLEDGVPVVDICKQSTNTLVTEDRVRDIKRRRCYKEISKNFNF